MYIHSVIVKNNGFQLQEYQEIAAKIRKFYFKDTIIDERSLLQYLKLLSDINFAYGIDKSARKHALKSNANTFYYR